MTTPVETRTPRSPAEHAAVERLADRVEAATGERPATGPDHPDGAEGPGTPTFAVWAPGRDVPAAYVRVTRPKARWEVELTVDPELRAESPDRAAELAVPALAAARAAVAARGGGRAYLWVPGVTGADDRMAAAAGFAPDRDLWQMTVPLPLPPDVRGGAPLPATRPFVAGKDEGPWVEVNNRAFAWHPEQGGWTVDDLLVRAAEPWFDPEGFLLHERDGRLAGFCWTKVHARHDPPLGEIYVIAVDPDFAGQGLGRGLTVAGLDHLARRGLTVGMLYVDAGNTPAVRLYESLGFAHVQTNRAYAADVAPEPDGGP